jgi:hypothetical protein
LNKGAIAVKNNDCSIKITQCGAGLIDGVTGAQLGFLPYNFHLWIFGARSSAHRLKAMASDNNRPFRVQGPPGAHSVEQHGRTCHLVQNFWQLRLHSGAFSRGKNDECDIHLRI